MVGQHLRQTAGVAIEERHVEGETLAEPRKIALRLVVDAPGDDDVVAPLEQSVEENRGGLHARVGHDGGASALERADAKDELPRALGAVPPVGLGKLGPAGLAEKGGLGLGFLPGDDAGRSEKSVGTLSPSGTR